ncbi:Lrp/AsnC family transcriptional regulator [Candidatus Micrarchaeota archaeon]|nr:Lrp/AsnC family transcriptional regulator [Candidatus Micrarchaeota archaeon]
MKGEYDRLDLVILNHLAQNSKLTYKELGEKIGTHQNTLIQRIKKLERDGIIIKHQAAIDYKKLGYEVQGLILLRIKQGTVGDDYHLEQIKDIPEVVAVYAITGNYDVAAVVKVKKQEDIGRILKLMQNVPAVSRTASHIILHTYKHHYEFNPLKDFVSMKPAENISP